VIPAIFGLVGVIVGGLVSGVVSAGLDRVRDARRALVSARLVQDDLSYLHAVLDAEIEEGVWRRLTADEPPLAFDAWTDGRDLLAAHLSFAEWNVASIAARQALRVVQVAPMNPKPGQAITANERANLASMLADIWAGTEVLQPLSHGRRVPSLWQAITPRVRG
jgi:hypothetical protein